MSIYLITGAAGFIGYHLTKKLLDDGKRVIGIDSLNEYYDVHLKKSRLYELRNYKLYNFYQLDISEKDSLRKIFEIARPDYVVNLAAYAGIPYSLRNPFAYQQANCDGFLNILEIIKEYPVKNFVYASSSSVYGNAESPQCEDMDIKRPTNMYAASKAFNEMQAYVYNFNYGIPSTGLRYFTVFGPWPRPDMMMYLWTRALYNRMPVIVNNRGDMWRDFTYVDDIVDGTIAAINKTQDYGIYNLAGGRTTRIGDVLPILMNLTGVGNPYTEMREMPQGEVIKTEGDISKAREELGYSPKVTTEEGISKLIEWYDNYYDIYQPKRG